MLSRNDKLVVRSPIGVLKKARPIINSNFDQMEVLYQELTKYSTREYDSNTTTEDQKLVTVDD